MSKSLEKSVIGEAEQFLIGRTVVGIEYLSAREAGRLGWRYRPATIRFDDGTRLSTLCDEEGNDAGVIMLNTQHGELCLCRFPI